MSDYLGWDYHLDKASLEWDEAVAHRHRLGPTQWAIFQFICFGTVWWVCGCVCRCLPTAIGRRAMRGGKANPDVKANPGKSHTPRPQISNRHITICYILLVKFAIRK